MLCKAPYMVGVAPYGCSQCMPCRINRRRVWTHRLVLESIKAGGSSFVTLTYDDDHLPAGGTLDPSHTQRWLKRFRKEISPAKIRYFLVGEYGDETLRPHYHLALFGAAPYHAVRGVVLSDVVRQTWGFGHTYVGDLTPASAAYVAGYVTKKMTNKDDPRLGGRHPEFARMSNGGRNRSGGIGASAMEEVVACLSTDVGLNHVADSGDVPSSLKHGLKSMPLGRYLRGKIRQQLGFGSTGTPSAALQKFGAEMRFVLEEEIVKPENAQKSIRQILVDMNEQKRLNLVGRTKIHESRRKL